MIAGTSPWSRQQLQRARPAQLLEDQQVMVASPEDVILGKLAFYREGGSDKHIRDITGILISNVVDIDRKYIHEHAVSLGLLEEWQSIEQKLGE